MGKQKIQREEIVFLKVDQVSIGEAANYVLRDISFTQARNEKVAIVGETGSGKSTLLKIIAGLVQPDTGEVVLEGTRVKGPHEKLVAGHDHIHYLSQHFELPKFLRVEQVLAYANALTPNKAMALYKVCDIDHLLKRRTDELSGGEKQRIALARILISSPKLILLDEPFSNLDILHKNILQQVVTKITRQLKIACTLVSHDPEDILPWADKVIVLRHGAVLQQGSPHEIYHQPLNDYVAGLFGEYNLIDKKPLLKKLGLSEPSIIRPNDIFISKNREQAVKAIIEETSFHGGFYVVTANAMDFRIKLFSPSSFEPGTLVCLRVRKRRATNQH